jgi:hypothetical protein
VAIKGGHTLDIFAGRISYDFGLSEAMWQRGKKTRLLGKADKGMRQWRTFSVSS